MQTNYKKSINLNYIFIIITLLGFAFRVMFYLFGAEKYFGRAEFYYNSDSIDYLTAIKNLVETGIYTTSFEFEDGKFCRSPTYAFFIGIFYYVTGENLNLTFKYVVYTQIIFDTVTIILFYYTSKKLFGSTCGLISASLYAFYPFSVIWTATAYSETLTTFLLIIATFLFVEAAKEKKRMIFIASGIVLGIAVLSRVQLLVFFLLVVLIGYIYVFLKNTKNETKLNGLLFIVGFIFIYSLWPLRNYFLHNRLVFTVTFVPNSYTKDVMSAYKFLGYISPNEQAYNNFLAILHNEDLDIPKFATRDKDDSIKIFNTINNAKNNGFGFSFFWDYWKTERPNSKDSIEAISNAFDELSFQMIRKYPLKTHLEIPLLNLKKMFFKHTLTNNSNFSSSLVRILFLYRSFILLLGVGSCFYVFSKFNINYFQFWFSFAILTYFLSWYFFMAFGPYRNIEIRYLLYCDVLLLIPAAFVLSLLPKNLKWLKFQ
jgi:4-amino-4-deoxy-L-arabinose transferase-like glycosyltransferase